jgi:hypothetical protein
MEVCLKKADRDKSRVRSTISWPKNSESSPISIEILRSVVFRRVGKNVFYLVTVSRATELFGRPPAAET